ncbi:hypothetical protein OPV22_021339 [Ensete ventricosum]|uniref:Uncharacterized protein n=1 Tax=Ensete ventricosum TaxID=4639 RepID=A0AAV8QGW0_ENSVE|nr:hypothetical protein OPV22_021339 [Ensete ventricosum]
MAAPLESVISIKSNTLKAASKSSHLLDHTSRPPRYCAASVNRSSHDLDREGAAAGGVHHCVPSVCASQEDLGVLATHGEEGLGGEEVRGKASLEEEDSVELKAEGESKRKDLTTLI